MKKIESQVGNLDFFFTPTQIILHIVTTVVYLVLEYILNLFLLKDNHHIMCVSGYCYHIVWLL